MCVLLKAGAVARHVLTSAVLLAACNDTSDRHADAAEIVQTYCEYLSDCLVQLGESEPGDRKTEQESCEQDWKVLGDGSCKEARIDALDCGARVRDCEDLVSGSMCEDENRLVNVQCEDDSDDDP